MSIKENDNIEKDVKQMQKKQFNSHGVFLWHNMTAIEGTILHTRCQRLSLYMAWNYETYQILFINEFDLTRFMESG